MNDWFCVFQQHCFTFILLQTFTPGNYQQQPQLFSLRGVSLLKCSNALGEECSSHQFASEMVISTCGFDSKLTIIWTDLNSRHPNKLCSMFACWRHCSFQLGKIQISTLQTTLNYATTVVMMTSTIIHTIDCIYAAQHTSGLFLF